MRRFVMAATAVAAVVAGPGAAGLAAEPGGAAGGRGDAKERPKVQIAVLLDTSGSMSGLIAQAKTELWKVVNEFVKASVDGVRPELTVALYEYGKSSLTRESGFIRQILPLTDDLDRVSQELFALTTNGGQEYCGWVIDRAAKDLEWGTGRNDLKLIFIAGNEPFTQGKVDYREACRLAVSKGITVNTIFCGNAEAGERTGWKEGATLADGSYASIDHNRAVAHVAAPQDGEIAALNRQLNGTYVPYGDRGAAGLANQAAQDANAASSGSLSSRAQTKASDLYHNGSWELVDAVAKGDVKVEDVKEEDLPEEMRKMTQEEREAHVEGQQARRRELQARIQTLSEERQKHVAAQAAAEAASGAETLDRAMARAVREQAARNGYEMGR